MQLHKLYHLCLFNHSVFNNSYSNSVFGQRWTREGFCPMELCQYLTTTPVAQANLRLSEILESFLDWHPQYSTSLQLQIYFHRNLHYHKLQTELVCSIKHKISTLKNVWTVKYFYYYHHLVHSTCRKTTKRLIFNLLIPLSFNFFLSSCPSGRFNQNNSKYSNLC